MKKKIYTSFITIVLIGLNVSFVFAEDWAIKPIKLPTNSHSLFVLVLVIAVILVIPVLIKKKWKALAVIIMLVGISLFFEINPSIIKNIGKSLSNIL